jgi:hypothetical protein
MRLGMSKKLKTFDCAADAQAYLFDKNKRRLERFAGRMWVIGKYFRDKSYVWGNLIQTGPILSDVASMLLDPSPTGYTRVRGTSHPAHCTIYLSIGLARNNSRLVIMIYHDNGGIFGRTASFMTAFRMECCDIGRDDKRAKFDAEFLKLMDFIDKWMHDKTCNKFSTMKDEVGKYLMPPRDAIQVLREATDFDID